MSLGHKESKRSSFSYNRLPSHMISLEVKKIPFIFANLARPWSSGQDHGVQVSLTMSSGQIIGVHDHGVHVMSSIWLIYRYTVCKRKRGHRASWSAFHNWSPRIGSGCFNASKFFQKVPSGNITNAPTPEHWSRELREEQPWAGLLCWATSWGCAMLPS